MSVRKVPEYHIRNAYFDGPHQHPDTWTDLQRFRDSLERESNRLTRWKNQLIKQENRLKQQRSMLTRNSAHSSMLRDDVKQKMEQVNADWSKLSIQLEKFDCQMRQRKKLLDIFQRQLNQQQLHQDAFQNYLENRSAKIDAQIHQLEFDLTKLNDEKWRLGNDKHKVARIIEQENSREEIRDLCHKYAAFEINWKFPAEQMFSDCDSNKFQ